MLAFVREGDTLVFESLERLGRNSDEILDTVSFIDKNGMGLMVLNLPILDTKFGDPNLEKLVRSLVISIFLGRLKMRGKKLRESKSKE